MNLFIIQIMIKGIINKIKTDEKEKIK